jgi:hypothetical protein
MAATVGGTTLRGRQLAPPLHINGLPTQGLVDSRRPGTQLATPVFAEGTLRYLAPPAPSLVATLVSFTTRGAPLPATRPAAPSARRATCAGSMRVTEVPASPEAATPTTRGRLDLRVGTPRSEEPERGGSDGGPGDLYRLGARDRPGVQTHREVVEGADTSFISLGQQRKSPFPSSLDVPILTTY